MDQTLYLLSHNNRCGQLKLNNLYISLYKLLFRYIYIYSFSCEFNAVRLTLSYSLNLKVAIKKQEQIMVIGAAQPKVGG